MPFSPFHLVHGSNDRGLVLLADHAHRDLPEEYGSLGLPPQQFERHIAYDIGVEPLTRKLAAMLGVPAVLGGFSRLLIDPNRGEDDPTLIMRLSDGAIIPGNNPMPDAEHQRRVNDFYRPYHTAVSDMIQAVAGASGKAPLVISIHSFTAFWKPPLRRGLSMRRLVDLKGGLLRIAGLALVLGLPLRVGFAIDDLTRFIL